MQLNPKQRVWTLAALALGGLWSVLALFTLDFAVIISAAIGATHTIGFVAAFTRLLERRLLLVAGLVISILVTYVPAGLLLFVACEVSLIGESNSSLCPNGRLDPGYVVLATGWAIIGAITFFFAWLAGKREAA